VVGWVNLCFHWLAGVGGVSWPQEQRPRPTPTSSWGRSAGGLSSPDGVVVCRQTVGVLKGAVSESEHQRTIPGSAGPLTNIAVALKTDVHFQERIQRLVVMGGAEAVGNITPVAGRGQSGGREGGVREGWLLVGMGVAV